MSDHKSDDRGGEHDDRRDNRGGDHGQTSAKVTAITALSADTGASHTDFITSQALQTVSGTFSGILKSGETIEVSADGGLHWSSASVSGSSWSASGVTLVLGSGTLITRIVDSHGHELLAGASHAYILDTSPVAPPSLLASFNDTGASATDGITSANKATLSGTADAGATVKIYDDGTLIATVKADQHGTWTQSVKGLAEGAHAFTAVQIDLAGNTSAHSLASTMTVDTTVAAPTLVASFVDSGVSASDGITNATAATLSGTAEAGATVKVYDGSKVIGTVNANVVTGAWSFDATGLQDGTHNFSAKQTDLAGNTSKSSDASAMTVDTVAPSLAPTLVASFVDTGISNSDKITSATTAELSGKTDKNALVQIYDGATLIATVTADKHGAWTYTAVNLPDGAHSFTAAQADVAGNLSASSAASTMTVAALAPPPGVALLNDTGVSDSDRITHDGTLKLSGVQVGATVQYSIDGGAHWAGSFVPHEGANSVQVRQTDLAGNVSSATTLAFTLDTSVAAPSVALAHDTGFNGDNITSDGALAVTGTESGAKVEYSTDGSHWATTFTASEGVNSVQVRQTDVAGNVSSATPLNFTLDTVVAAPGVALAHDTGFNGDNITSDSTLTLAGIETGATVRYSLDGGTSWTGSFTPIQGQNSVQVRQTDVAGNISDATTLDFSLDTTVPGAPTVALANDTGSSASDYVSKVGTLVVTPAEPGGTVQYSIDGINWSASFSAHEGVNTLQVRQVDDAGNTSTATPFQFTLDTSIAAPQIAAVVDNVGPVTGTVAVGGTTDDTKPTLNGTAEANSKITVYDGPNVIGPEITTDASGHWTFTPATDLGVGANHSFSVHAVDLAGNAAASNAYAITIGTVLHAPVLTATLTEQPYTDGTGLDNFSPASGTLSATETGVTSFSYSVTGAASATPSTGFDIAAAGQYGTVNLNSTSGAYEFVPDNAAINALPQGANASDSFTFWVDDGQGGNDSKTLTINLTGANDTPVLSASLTAKTYTDSAAADVFAPVNGVLSTADADLGATHSYSVTGVSAAAATLAGYDTAAAGHYGTVYLNSSSGAYVFVPDNAAINALPAGSTPSDSFTLSVLDNAGGTDSRTLNISLVGANDTPTLSASRTSASYIDTSAYDTFNPVTGTLTSTDRDTGAPHTYSVTGLAAAPATLAGYDTAAAGHYGTVYLNSSSGVYTFVPDITAINALVGGANASDIFTLSVSDGSLNGTSSKSLTINLQGANDASIISGVSGPLNYSVGDAPVAVAPLLTLGDVDSGTATSATVAISAGFHAGNDTLSFTTPADITGVYNSQTGILQFTANTLTGNAPLPDFQAALASVQFSTTTSGGRTISYTVFDGAVASTTVDTSSISLDVLTTTGFRAPGTNFHDFSGFSVHNAGDINGDGFADVIIGAPFADGGVGGGASYVIFGKATSFGSEAPLASLGVAGAIGETAGFRISAHNTYDAFGSSVSSAGDVNGDGYADLIIGAPRAGANDSQAGAAYVIFGHDNSTPFGSNPDGSILDLSTPLNGTNGFKISGVEAHDWVGYAVSTAGDLNGDGFADLLIGSQYATRANGSYAGAAYVVFGHGGAAPFGTDGNLDLSSLNGSNGFKMSTPASAVSVNSVSNAGDVNGDGFGDLIIGATLYNSVDYSYHPATYVVFGHATPFGTNGNLNLSALNGSTGFSISSNADASRGQHTVSSAGDVNGDGFADLIVGVPYATTVNGVESGAAYVIFGKAGGFSSNVDVSALTPSTGFSITGAAAHDWAGYSVSAAGDVNGDGYGDLIVGAPHALGAHASSESYVIFGQAPGLLHNIDLSNLSPSDGFRLSGVGLGDASGYAVSAAGDVNGDGFADLIVGAAYASPNGHEYAGESYVVFGSKFIVGTNTYVGSSALHLLTGSAANDHFIAGSSSDTTMIGNGGVDSFSGGAGNDTMHLGLAGSSDSRFLRIEGGSGFDTLALDGSGMNLNLTTAGVDGRIHGIERVDLGNSNNSLTLDLHDVLNMSPSGNQLFVTGQSGSVSSLGQGWLHAPGGLVTDHGISYDSYTLGGAAYTQGMANLLIDHNLLLANAAHLS